MKSAGKTGIFILAALMLTLGLATGCSTGAGADIYLKGANIGAVSIDGKPVTGLPTQTVDIVLKTGAKKVIVSQSEGKTVIKLEPSGAEITSSSEGLSFTGVDSKDVSLQWEESTTTKTTK